ncbi:MAG: ATP-binding domain-containing protein, partial [Bacteroidaceae bacterium]|nr:ATP-binding domain-containing protein [Bacteroidaceae bacterium]
LLDTLQSESPALTQKENERLYNKVMEDYEDLSSQKEKLLALRKDAYFNALQVKYAYAVTCHKSQGGQWAHVYLDQGYMPKENLTSDYFHWLYTAFTRATEKLFLINWPE